MRTKFYLDKRTEQRALASDIEREREWPVKIAINHKGSSAYLPTGVSVQERCWVSKPGVGTVVNTPMAARLNIALSEKKLAVDKAIEELREKGELHGASASEIKALVQKKLERSEYDENGGEVPVLVCFERAIKTKDRKRTIAMYRWTMAKLQAYEDFSPNTTFRAITPAWLSGFEAHLAKTSPSANARAVYLRSIRAVFNFAIEEKLTNAPYPFKRFKIRKAPTADRSLTPEELRTLYDAPCNGTAQKYRDLFFLSFYLCGMNIEDILSIRPGDIKGGRVEIRRIKTGQPLSIKIEDEAYIIINKYKDNSGERLISVGKCKNYVDLLHRLNDNLKRIGQTYNPKTRRWEGCAVLPDISYYWARYSWATIAAELDIPEKTASYGMGHNTAKTVTSIYTRVDMRKKLDEANRKIIDYCQIGKNLESRK